MEAISCITLGLSGPPLWLDVHQLLYATGNGLVAQDLSSGVQRHIWLSGNKALGGSAGCPQYAVCPGRNIVAWSQNGENPSIFIASTIDFHSFAVIKDVVKEIHWAHLAFSQGGDRLAAVGGFPDHVLEIWAVPGTGGSTGTGSTVLAASHGADTSRAGEGAEPGTEALTCLARVAMGPRLVALPPVFFPLNQNVVLVAGHGAARLIVLQPMLNGHVVHESDVDVSLLSEGEDLCSTAWAPDGTALLGTTLGRILAVPGAAPAAVPDPAWGQTGGGGVDGVRTAGGGHTAVQLYAPAAYEDAARAAAQAVASGTSAATDLPSPKKLGIQRSGLGAGVSALNQQQSQGSRLGAAGRMGSGIMRSESPQQVGGRGCSSSGVQLSSASAALAAGTLPLSPEGRSMLSQMSRRARRLAPSTTINGRGDRGPEGALPAVPPTAVVAIFVIQSHVVAVLAGGEPRASVTDQGLTLSPGDMAPSTPAQLLWLCDPSAHGGKHAHMAPPAHQSGPALKVAAVSDLPTSGAISAALCPSLASIILTSRNGDLVRADLSLTSSVAASSPHPHSWGASGSPLQRKSAFMGSGGEEGACDDDDVREGGHKVDQGTGEGVSSPPVQLTARKLGSYHAGRITGVVMLQREMFATGGVDGTVRLWRVRLSEAPQNASVNGLPSAGNSLAAAGLSGMGAGVTATASASLVAMWTLGSRVTVMCGFRLTSLIVVGTEDGALRVFNGDRVAAFLDAEAQGSSAAAFLEEAMAVGWAQRPFPGHPVTALAFSPDGDFCAVVSATAKQLAFYRVVSNSATSSEVALHTLGFYSLSQAPSLLAWAPRDTSIGANTRMPLLVVATTNGEMQVLSPPESLVHLRQDDAALGPTDCLVGLLRAQSTVSAMVTLPAPEQAGAAEGTFWVVACCTDKSIRRFRVPMEQHKAAARSAIAARGQPPTPSLQRQTSSSSAKPQGSNSASTVPVITASQNFQMPESEKTLDLFTPAVHAALSSSGKHMVVTTLDGSTNVYSLPELTSVARWPMSAPAQFEDTALAAQLAGATGMSMSGGLQLGPQGPLPVPRCAAAGMGSRLLVTAGEDGAVHVVEYSLTPGVAQARSRALAAASTAAAARTSTASFISVSAGSGLGAGGRSLLAPALPVLVHTLASTAKLAAPPGLGSAGPGAGAAAPFTHNGGDVLLPPNALPPVASWKEARLMTQRQTKANEYQASADSVAAKIRDWQARLAVLRERNDAADESERLPESEFVMDLSLQQELGAEGEVRVAETKAAAKRAWVEPEVQRDRLTRMLLGNVEAHSEEVTAIKEHTFISPMTADDLKRWKDQASRAVPPVASYPVRKLTEAQELVLRKVSFLRRVEQAEWSARSSDQRGQITMLRRYKGKMATNFGLESAGLESAAQTPRDGPSAETDDEGEGEEVDVEDINKQKADKDDIEGNEVHNGACRLLYAPLQLHTPTRKAAQAILLQDEGRVLQRAFNVKWAEMRAHKERELDRIDERHTRLAEIQKELGGAPHTVTRAALACDTPWKEQLEVADHEVTAEKWVSPEERARLEAAAAAEAEARRRAEADDARQRALREMMNATLEIKKKEKNDNALVREAWMDLPRTQLTAEQRKQLAEFEKREAELNEEREKARRQLETERKALEVECADITAEFNTKLWALNTTRIKVDVELRALEVHALDCASAVEELRAAAEARARLSSEVEGLRKRLVRRRVLLGEARKAADAAAKQYDALAGQERALDKLLRRELGNREDDVWEEVQRVYRDRKRRLTGNPIRPASEVLGKVPEGQLLQASPSPSPQVGVNRQPSLLFDPLLTGLPSEPEVPLPEPPPLLTLTRWISELRAARSAGSRKGHSSRAGGTSHQDASAGGGAAEQGGTQQQQRGSEAGGAGPHTYPSARGSPHTRPPSGTHSGSRPNSGQHLPQQQQQQRLKPGSRPGSGVQAAGSGTAPDPHTPAGGSRRGSLAGRPGEAPQHQQPQQQQEKAKPAGASGQGPRVEHILADLAASRVDRVQGLARHPVESLLALTEHPSARPLGPLLEALALGKPLVPSLVTQHPGRLGLNPPDVGGDKEISDPFTSPSLTAAYSPAQALSTRHDSSNAPPPSLPDEPFSSSDRPPDLEESWWVRLLEMRDTRISLEQAADEAWERLAWANLGVCHLEREAQELDMEAEEATRALAAVTSAGSHATMNVLLTYRLSNGQVEPPRTAVAEDDDEQSSSQRALLASLTLGDATLLHRWAVERVNSAILERGSDKLGTLGQISSLSSAMHMTQWEVAGVELRVGHAQQDLTDIQLLHVTKELQAVLRDPSTLARMDGNAALQRAIEAAATSHGGRMRMRQRAYARLTERVATNIQAHGELEGVTQVAQTAFLEAARVTAVVNRNRALDDAAHRRALRAIVTNVQLKDIAQQQAAEIAELSAEVERLRMRTFPSLAPALRPGSVIPGPSRGPSPGVPAWTLPGAPDLRVPGGPRRPATVATMGGSAGRPLSSLVRPAPGHTGGSNTQGGVTAQGPAGSLGGDMISAHRPASVPAGMARAHRAGGSLDGSTAGPGTSKPVGGASNRSMIGGAPSMNRRTSGAGIPPRPGTTASGRRP